MKTLLALAVIGIAVNLQAAPISVVTTNTIPANTNLQQRVIRWMDSDEFPVGPKGSAYQARLRAWATGVISNAIVSGVRTYEAISVKRASATNHADGVVE